MPDDKFFQTTRKGELHELKTELHSSNKEKKKDAVKKVIAAMTVGKDVSSLFPDVVNCMQTSNLELKKLVYLYVINYARVQPELAILAVNTFRKDASDPNPLVRALAVRTMGCIRLEQITEYLIEPLRRCCKDPEPYVRKTAAICIAKLFDLSPSLVQEQGFLKTLQDMLGDSNPMVVSNSVAALNEISEKSSKPYLKQIINSNSSNISRLLAALNECTEWSQVFILDALALYDPPTPKDAVSVLERVVARLSHANSAVVLSAIKVVMKLLDKADNPDVVKAMQRKLSPPLVTLLSAEPEIQYVALRNISLIIQKRPGVLASEVRMFFCKYNDPVYVKMEKLEVIVRLTTERNVEQVLNELKEYALEVDVEFIRKAIRAIGRCAIKLPSAAERGVNVLLDLIETKVNYVIQEAIVVIKDIFRKYPNKYESIIGSLCENLDSLDEPEAKASLLWIIGEYAERIDNADDLIASFLLTFLDEPINVQLQLLTATVKLFLKSPANTQDMVTKVLKLATESSDNPDLRDRAFIYWRLLSSNPEATKRVVLSQKPPINDNASDIDPLVLDRLIENISMLSSVFHKVPESFVSSLRLPETTHVDTSEDEDEVGKVEKIQHQMENQEYESSPEGGSSTSSESAARSSDTDGEPEDLLSLDSDDESRKKESKQNRSLSKAPIYVERSLLAATQPGSKGFVGLAISGGMLRTGAGQIQLKLTFINSSSQTINGWAIQFNKNAFGLAPAEPITIEDLVPGSTAHTTLAVKPNQLFSNTPPANALVLQVAIKTNLDIFYFGVPCDFSVLLVENGKLEMEKFRDSWQGLGEAKQSSIMALAHESLKTAKVIEQMAKINCFFVATRTAENFEASYFSAVTENQLSVLIEISVQKAGPGVKISVRSEGPAVGVLMHNTICLLFKLQQKT